MLRILCAICLMTWLPAADWPHFRGPDQASGTTSDSALRGWQGAEQRWTAEVGTGFASVVVADGKALTLGNERDTDIVRCFDVASGRELWRFEYAAKLEPRAYAGGPNATPTIADGFVYGVSKQGLAWCLKLADGSRVWQRDLAREEGLKPPKWGFAGAPLVHGTGLFLNAGPAGIALDRRSGTTVWSSGRGGGAGYASPVLAGERGPLVIFAAKHLIGLDPARGKELWRAPWETKFDVNAATPVAVGGGWFVSTGYGRGCGLIVPEAGSAQVAWENRNMMTQMSGCVLLGEQLYGVSAHSKRPGELRCLDPQRQAAVVWKQGGFGQGSLIAVDDKLLVLSGDGELAMVAAEPAGYRELGRARILDGTCWTPPSYADGLLFARNGAGRLVCVQLR